LRGILVPIPDGFKVLEGPNPLVFVVHNGWTAGYRSAILPAMTRLSIRIDFEPSGSVFGPGMAELLERIGKLGSIRKAAASMEMSYRKAWLLVQGLQQTFGGAVVLTETGGTSGGGAQLTELGLKLIKAYRAIEANAAAAAEQDMRMLAAMVHDDARPRGRRAPKSPPA
jgi:molybdate transport system regulatory protein